MGKNILHYFFIIVLAQIMLSCGGQKTSSLEERFGPRPSLSLYEDNATNSEKIDWRQEIVYFVLIDRFFDGDPTNNAAGNANSHVLFNPKLNNTQALKTYQGGDLAGLLEQLPYLKGLGITTIWLSPIYDNSNEPYFGYWAYHGYHPRDFYKVDEHFGDMELMKRVCDEAHNLGLKIVLDIINNHTARDHPFVSDPTLWRDQGYNKWFHAHDKKGSFTDIRNWKSQREVEEGELAGLPDFDQDNPHVYDYLLDVSKYWISNLGVDGFRLDTVRHVPKDYWQRFNADIKAFAGDDFLLLGEVFENNNRYLKQYKNLGFTSLFNFSLQSAVIDVFTKGASMTRLSEEIGNLINFYDGDELPALFIDNHDLTRFRYLAGDEQYRDKLRMALTFINTLNGLPLLYYGTEIGLEGGPKTDPFTGEGSDYLNRKMMDFGREERENRFDNLTHFTRTLNYVRRENPVLYKGSILELYRDKLAYVYAKIDASQIAIIAINNYSEARYVDLPLAPGFLVPYLDEKVPSQIPGIEVSGTPPGAPTAAVEWFQGKLINTSLKKDGESLKFTLQPYSADVFIFPNTFGYEMGSSQNFSTDESSFSIEPVKVKFNFKTPRTDISKIVIRGAFNDWGNGKEYILEFNNETQAWEVEIPLNPGDYAYKFVIIKVGGGEDWISDESASKFENDGFGGQNSVIQVRR